MAELRELNTEDAAGELQKRGNPRLRLADEEQMQLSRPRGIGLAKEQTVTPPEETPQMPEADIQPRKLDPAFAHLEGNTLGKIGLVLSNAAAGFRGQELPTTRLRREHTMRKELEMRQLGLALKAAEQGIQMFSDMDPDDPATKRTIKKFISQFESVAPGLENFMKVGIEAKRRRGVEALAGMREHAEALYGVCGLDAACIRKHVLDKDFMERLNETADEARTPSIIQKFQAIGDVVGDDLINELKKDGWTAADLQKLPEAYRFTREEIRTINRSESLQNALIPLGFIPPEVSRKGLEAEMTAKAKARFEGQKITPTQRANNKEIDLAREHWNRVLDEQFDGDGQAMLGAVFQTNPLTKGLEPKDKGMADLWAKAKERKVGDDPDFRGFIDRFVPKSESRGTLQPPPEPEEGPGLFEGLIDSITGGGTPGPGSAYEAEMGGKRIYSDDGQTWFFEDGTPVE